MRNKEKNWRLLFGGAVSVCFLAAGLSLCLGNISIMPVELFRILCGGGEGISRSILLYARLPRTIAALSAGAALATSGAVLQPNQTI